MRTLIAQSAVAVCLLVFAFLARRVARRLPEGERVFRYGWAITAAAFLVQGVNLSLHGAFAIVAYRAGAGSRLWDAILVWNPILNHSRTFLLTAYCVVLSVVLIRANRGRPLLPLHIPLLLMMAGMFVGGLVGWNEEAFSGLTHYTAVAMWDIMELLALLSVLLVGLATGGMDRSLWASLGVNAFVLALSVLWFAYLSRIDIAGQWSPRPYHVQLSKALLYLVMIVIAYRHSVRLRQGKPARALLDLNPRRALPSLHG